jgi:hypothetical protein
MIIQAKLVVGRTFPSTTPQMGHDNAVAMAFVIGVSRHSAWSVDLRSELQFFAPAFFAFHSAENQMFRLAGPLGPLFLCQIAGRRRARARSAESCGKCGISA